MKTIDVLNSKVGAVLAIGGLVAVGVYVAGKQTAKAAEYVGEQVNPTSQDNIFYRGANAVGETLTGEKNFNLGYWLHKQFNG